MELSMRVFGDFS